MLAGRISGTGPGTNPGRDTKIGQANLGLGIYWTNILGSQLSPSSINLVPAQAGKVTVGLASHWPCVTDNSGITTYGLTAFRKGDEHPP